MLKKIKNIILRTDNFLFKFFGSDRTTQILQKISEAQEIFLILNEKQFEVKVRFVGGCVRKALNAEDIDDIDLATSLTPEEVKKKLNKKNIKVIDTGISHGTVTAIINKKKFEITTLRQDITTDGRHANVEFSLSWENDASRRDFTINAIYADIQGRVFDPLNGASDLKNGIVKFIGIPEERIQEDYLRILRYFRFFSHYSKIDHDLNVIKSIKKNINGLNKISNERIYLELNKILKLENFYSLFLHNQSKEIILNIFPQFKYYERLKIFNTLSKKLKKQYDNCLILALLMVGDSNDQEYFCHKYKVSNNIKKRLKNISLNYENVKSKNFFLDKNIKKLIYFSNKEEVMDLLFFSLCLGSKLRNLNIEKLIHFVRNYKVPKFPISGEYLKKYGYKTGEIIGKKLKFLETEWVKNNFTIDKKFIRNYLEKSEKN